MSSTSFSIRRLTTRAFVMAGVLALLAPGSRAPILAEQTPATTGKSVSSTGQSATLLADGSSLLIGGEGSRSFVQLRDPNGTVATLDVSPLTPRAWHTATVLADGSVLIVGGIDSTGRTVAAPERFIPATRTFEALPADGFAARARHTATLMTDGRVLIVGGDSGTPRDDADLWDPKEQVARPLGSVLEKSRVGHTATLLADGRVLITGGETTDGSPPPEAFNPATGRFEPAQAGSDLVGFHLAQAVPSDGATAVPVDSTITIRLSRPANVQSLTAGTITLTGPDGQVATTLVPAESGRLLFLRPVESLRPASRYVLVLAGVSMAQGITIAPASVSFRTKDAVSDSRSQDDEEAWVPTGADGWRSGRGPSPWQNLPPLTAPPGVTAVAGQVLKLDGRPLADVTLEIEGTETRTDETGRFLLLMPGMASGRCELEIKGETASRPGRTYGLFEVGVTIAAARTTVLPYTIWMPRIDTAHAVRIVSPTLTETVVRTPFIPGLELHLPAGSVIKDEEGQIVREVIITPIPVDRPPFPLPKNVEVPIYFTIQPGGAYVYNVNASAPRGAQIVYPNYNRLADGIIANFWHYDPPVKDWYVYGPGKVKGTQVFPDARTRIYAFTGAMFTGSGTPPGFGPPPGWSPSGDPVDASTGLFVLEKTDLYLPDVIPLSLHRTYRPADSATRPFGIGATHDYAMFIYSAQQYTKADLILPDGARVHYARTSGGSGWVDAVFEHTASPTQFYKSTIVWNGNGWDLRLRDGTVYVFGENAPLQAIRDRFGNTLAIQHANGQSGNITRVTSPNGRWIAFTYDASNRVTQATDNSGRNVAYQYDASGRLWKVTDAAGGVTTYTYDTSHRLLTITDPRSITYLTNQYDANNRVTLQTQADTTTYQFAYTLDGGGKVTQADVTNPRGYVTRTAFNASGYPATVVEAVGQPEARTTTYTRDVTSSRITTVIDPLLRHTDYAYDTSGNLTSVTRLAGTANAVTTSLTYESTFNQVSSVTDPLNHTTTLTYDAQGHLTTVTDPLSHQTTFTYNPAGQPLTIANHLNETTTVGYDRGDAVSITNPLGNATTRFFDAVGRLLLVTDPLGRATRYEYDAVNHPQKITNPLGAETTFTYDANGNLLSLTDARAKMTTWTYDTMDRVATRTDPLARQESFAYDANGNFATATDRKAQVATYGYDALDRQTFVGFGTTGTPPSYASTISTTFDAGDRATQIVDSGAGTISQTYDLLDRLTEEVTPEGAVDYGYDAADRRAAMTVAGQTAVSYTYDNADRLTGVTQGTATVSLAYDQANRRTLLTLGNGIVVDYTYDTASRIAGLTYKRAGTTVGTLAYAYDADGQRVAMDGTYARSNLPSALASATYDDANQVATWGGTVFSYDANGNLTADGTRSYTWNARNELTGISGQVTASFGYDGFGRRRTKSIGGTTIQFLYDGLNPVQELSGGGVLANLLTGLGIDEYFTRTDVNGALNYLTDALGSSVALTNGSGTVLTEYTYEPFGSTTTSGASSGNTFGFTGREADGTGLYYYRARYYDPRAQRFLAEDPIGFGAGDPNLHAYAFNDPIGFVDPLGEAVMYLPWCDPKNPASRKFSLPFAPLLRTLFGDPCDPINMMPTIGPLGAPGPATGPLQRLAGPLRRLLRRLSPNWSPRIGPKITRQMPGRGWTPQQIGEAYRSGQRIPTTNYANGNPASRYIHPTTGQSMIIDDMTGQVIHVGGPGFLYPVPGGGS